MAKSESSKRLKASNGGIDRISDLPGPLISHILSLLPTKCAVATSILSTRWKFVWTSITNLDICSLKHHGAKKKLEPKNKLEMKRNKFTLFVNRALILLNPPYIQNFRLKCYQDYFDPSYLNSWISAGFGRTVREFKLSFKSSESLHLPLSHIYCNVAVLKLDGDIHLNIPAAAFVCFPSLQALHLHGITSVIASNSSVSFPNLKIMHLVSVNFSNEDSIQKLFSSSPVLDDLVIKKNDCGGVECLIIRIPSLTRLSIEFQDLFLDVDDVHEGMHKFQLQIDTPALQVLNLNVGLPFEYLPSKDLSSLIQANVEMVFIDRDDDNEERGINIIKFIESLSKVKFLSVSRDIMKAFRVASTNILPAFHNLTRLEIAVDSCLDFSIMVSNLLASMDNMEHLVIKGWCCYCSLSRQCSWNEPLNVPKCILSRVITISFSDIILGCCTRLELLRYFLKNAEVLQLLTIGTNHISEKKQLELVKKISLIPRGSRSCQVAFT